MVQTRKNINKIYITPEIYQDRSATYLYDSIEMPIRTFIHHKVYKKKKQRYFTFRKISMRIIYDLSLK